MVQEDDEADTEDDESEEDREEEYEEDEKFLNGMFEGKSNVPTMNIMILVDHFAYLAEKYDHGCVCVFVCLLQDQAHHPVVQPLLHC